MSLWDRCSRHRPLRPMGAPSIPRWAQGRRHLDGGAKRWFRCAEQEAWHIGRLTPNATTASPAIDGNGNVLIVMGNGRLYGFSPGLNHQLFPVEQILNQNAATLGGPSIAAAGASSAAIYLTNRKGYLISLQSGVVAPTRSPRTPPSPRLARHYHRPRTRHCPLSLPTPPPLPGCPARAPRPRYPVPARRRQLLADPALTILVPWNQPCEHDSHADNHRPRPAYSGERQGCRLPRPDRPRHPAAR